jgi:Flp pilus assembly protein TadG
VTCSGGRSSRGQTSVEFALAGIVLFVLFMGVIEVSRLLFGLSSITTAAREGGRYGIASGNVAAAQAQDSALQTACDTANTTGLKAAATSHAQGIGTVTVTAATYNADGPPHTVNSNTDSKNLPAVCTVTISWAYTPASGFFALIKPAPFTSTSQQYFYNNLK